MSAKSVQRRTILRNTWQRLYRDNTPFVSRFVVSRVDDVWGPLIRAENETYGDIIELSHLEESAHIANTIKSVEFFSYLMSSQPDRWDFVTKLDDDSFLDARLFWKTYLQPTLVAGTARETTWGRTLKVLGVDYTFAGGQFYTLTNDLVKIIAQAYSKDKISYMEEDALNSRLMFDGGANWTQIDLPSTIAFDYIGEDLLDASSACPWAGPNADLTKWVHAVGPGSLNPHKMKTDEDYLKVAACWDDAGYLRERPAS
jgi:beta-1,3-galactosyltransferase 1